jgi:hypothetical protein
MRAPILDSLEETFAQLGYQTQSEPGAKRLEMTTNNGLWKMYATAAEGGNFGSLYVYVDGVFKLFSIRLGIREPALLPEDVRPEGYELLKQLVDNCEPFQQDWLKEYLEDNA